MLALTLVLAGALAAVVHRQSVSHRHAAEAALRDYAAFAAWELERRTDEALRTTLQTAFVQARLPVEIAHLFAEGPERTGADALAGFEAGLRKGLERCGCGHAVRDFFGYDLQAGRPIPDDLPAPLEAWLRDSWLPEVSATASEGVGPPPNTVHLRFQREPPAGGAFEMERISSPFLMRAPTFFPLDGPEVRVAYATEMTLDGRVRGVQGFVIDVPAFTEAVVRGVVETAALLPPSLTRGAASDSLLALSVRLDGGGTVYRTAAAPDPRTRVTDTLHTDLGTLVLEASVRPEVAGSLVIGGLPRSRLPLLLALFGLALGLAAVAAHQLRRQRALARLRADFVAGVSHELRTPLAQIHLFAELLETGRLRAEQRERSVRVIREEARRLAYLVENVLRFSGAERGAARVTPEPVAVAPVVRDVVESFAPLAPGAALVPDLDDGLVAPADPGALRQILLNLLDNAVKYGPRGQRVGVRLDAHGGGVRLVVTDEGPGVPPGERERIWQPYRRLRRDAESATGGTGIGLAVVRDLAERHGGRASVGDAPGGGARFEVWLPGPVTRAAPGAGAPEPAPLAEAVP